VAYRRLGGRSPVKPSAPDLTAADDVNSLFSRNNYEDCDGRRSNGSNPCSTKPWAQRRSFAAAWIEAQMPGRSGDPSEVLSLVEAHDEMRREPAATSSEPAPVPGAQFGPYCAVELIGRGGMSAVYRARRADGQFEQTVALKILSAHLASPEFLRAFRRSGRSWRRCATRISRAWWDGGVSSAGDPFLITELIEGQTIDALLRRRPPAGRRPAGTPACRSATPSTTPTRNLIVHRDLNRPISWWTPRDR